MKYKIFAMRLLVKVVPPTEDNCALVLQSPDTISFLEGRKIIFKPHAGTEIFIEKVKYLVIGVDDILLFAERKW